MAIDVGATSSSSIRLLSQGGQCSRTVRTGLAAQSTLSSEAGNCPRSGRVVAFERKPARHQGVDAMDICAEEILVARCILQVDHGRNRGLVDLLKS